MMRGLRDGAWAKSGAPLPYDAEVEYLESTGTQYIDLGILVDSSTSISCDYSPIVLGVSNVAVLSAGNSGNSKCEVYCWGNNQQVYVGNSTKTVAATVGDSFSLLVGSGSFVLTNNSSGASVDGSYTFSGTSSDTLTLFALHRGGVYSYFGKCRIVALAVNGDDFAPVRFTNERGETEGAMFDRVSGQLFRNQGTGAFVIGPDKTA